nr:hypothetical protein [Desulfobacterales bacterium]
MLDLVKKGFLLGLGATMLTKERVEKLADDLVKRGKLTTEEAKKITKDFWEETKRDIESVQHKGKKEIERLFASFDIVTRAEFDMLEKRIKELEEALKSRDE